MMEPGRPAGSEIDDHPEAAERHAFAVERHRLRIHHVRETRILHRLRVHAIAILARLVDDPREPHLLAFLELHALREGSPHSVHHVIGDTFVVAERTVVHPDLAGLRRHLLVLRGVLLRDRDQESIDIGHGLSPLSPNCSAASRAYNAFSRSNSSCRPTAAMRPRSTTTIRSELMAVASRWAMTSVVRLRMSFSSASRTSRSLSESSELVASSSSRIGGFLRMARAMAMRCFWPPDSRAPRSPRKVS